MYTFNFFVALFICEVFLIINVSGEDTIFLSNVTNATSKNSTRFPMKLYLKGYSYIKGSKAFRNFTIEDTIDWADTVDQWSLPEMEKLFPYYLAGYDYEDRPIWVAEIGKYDVRSVVERGPKGLSDLEMYAFQAALRIIKSLYAKDTDEKEVRNVVIVGDFDGTDLSQLTHIPTVSFLLNLAATYLDISVKILGYAFAINVNYVAARAFDLLRPIFGGLFEKIELHGINKTKWMAALRRKLPDETIPPWYGGRKDFTPLQVYG